MTVRWRAPGRVNLIGEHTDYNEGFVLPIALPLGVTATVDPASDGTLHASSSSESESLLADIAGLSPGSVDGWAAYVAGVVWALRERGFDVPAASISVEGDLPYGAGLSSSAALECAVASALSDALGFGIAPADLVAVARAAENDFVGVPSGSLDQSASLLCTEGHALLLDCRSGERRQVPFDLGSAGLVLLVIDTKAPHRLVDGEYAARRRDCAEACSALGVRALRDVTDLPEALASLSDDRLRRRVRHIVTENERVLEMVRVLDTQGGPAAMGRLLSASHTSLRDDYEVSSPELDLAASAAEAAGAHGARMTGGGFGGSAIALVETAAVADVSAAVTAAFAQRGLSRPEIFPARASAGAHRVHS